MIVILFFSFMEALYLIRRISELSSSGSGPVQVKSLLRELKMTHRMNPGWLRMSPGRARMTPGFYFFWNLPKKEHGGHDALDNSKPIYRSLTLVWSVLFCSKHERVEDNLHSTSFLLVKLCPSHPLIGKLSYIVTI